MIPILTNLGRVAEVVFAPYWWAKKFLTPKEVEELKAEVIRLKDHINQDGIASADWQAYWISREEKLKAELATSKDLLARWTHGVVHMSHAALADETIAFLNRKLDLSIRAFLDKN